MSIRWKVLLLVILVASAVLSSKMAVDAQQHREQISKGRYVLVDGNVNQPGYYRVHPQTTRGELLRKAGLNDSSDIGQIALVQAVEDDAAIEVGVAETKTKRVERRGYTSPRLAFFVGKVFVKEGLRLDEPELDRRITSADELNTGADGQAKLIFDNKAELFLQSDGKLRIPRVVPEAEPQETEVALDEGKLLVRVPIATPGARLMLDTRTARVTLENQAAEFTLTGMQNITELHVKTGKVAIQAAGSDQAQEVGPGQYVSIRAGDRLVEVEEKPFEDVQVNQSFSRLNKNLTEYVESQKELSFLFAGHPNYYMVVSFLPKKKRVIIMDIPLDTYVGDYLDGLMTFDQALAYGGVELTRELAQRIIGREVKYFVSVGVEDVIDLVNSMGGVFVDLDAEAAVDLGIPMGKRRLDGEQMARYLRPSLRGRNEAMRKQKEVLTNVFRQFKKGELGLNPAIILDVWKSVNTNVPSDEIFKAVSAIATEEEWVIMTTTMPYGPAKKGPVDLVMPNYRTIRQIYD